MIGLEKSLICAWTSFESLLINQNKSQSCQLLQSISKQAIDKDRSPCLLYNPKTDCKDSKRFEDFFIAFLRRSSLLLESSGCHCGRAMCLLQCRVQVASACVYPARLVLLSSTLRMTLSVYLSRAVRNNLSRDRPLKSKGLMYRSLEN